MTTTRLRSTGLAALAFSSSLTVIGLTVATPASAQSVRDISVVAPADDEVLSARIQAGDLDLTSKQDVRRLEARVRSASRQVCSNLASSSLNPAQYQCQQRAQRAAAPQIAALRDKASSLAAAGLPTRIETSLTVVARDSE